MRKKKVKCNHDLNSSNNTLELLNFQTMVYPKKYFTVCKCCGQTFEFINENGRYELASKEE